MTAQATNKGAYTALWSYAWDLMAEGIDGALERIATTGANGVSLATSYHAGMFLLPHNPQQKVRFLEDGSIYFRPDAARFKGLAIQPRVTALADAIDPLDAICTAAPRYGVEVTSWTVCCHNTYQGTLHPELCLHNAFGDPYAFALCPSQPEVQAYLEALLGNLSQYPLRTLQLESYDYMGFYHGFHHEKFQLELGPLSGYLLGLCFCPACLQAARERGIDGEALRDKTAAWLVHAFEGEVTEPAAVTEGALEEAVPGLGAYLAMRDELTIRSLKGLIGASSVPLNLLGVKPKVLAAVHRQIGEVTNCAYVKDPAVVAQVATSTRELVGQDMRAGLGLEISPRFTPDAANMAAKINAARAAGADSLYLYN
ncbi:MAG: hypothetical protein LLG44_02870, partial [Chloroflexi bacterium]|nr:hypothetical protein [Chloroflexota bacterium]